MSKHDPVVEAPQKAAGASTTAINYFGNLLYINSLLTVMYVVFEPLKDAVISLLKRKEAIKRISSSIEEVAAHGKKFSPDVFAGLVDSFSSEASFEQKSAKLYLLGLFASIDVFVKYISFSVSMYLNDITASKSIAFVGVSLQGIGSRLNLLVDNVAKQVATDSVNNTMFNGSVNSLRTLGLNFKNFPYLLLLSTVAYDVKKAYKKNSRLWGALDWEDLTYFSKATLLLEVATVGPVYQLLRGCIVLKIAILNFINQHVLHKAPTKDKASAAFLYMDFNTTLYVNVWGNFWSLIKYSLFAVVLYRPKQALATVFNWIKLVGTWLQDVGGYFNPIVDSVAKQVAQDSASNSMFNGFLNALGPKLSLGLKGLPYLFVAATVFMEFKRIYQENSRAWGALDWEDKSYVSKASLFVEVATVGFVYQFYRGYITLKLAAVSVVNRFLAKPIEVKSLKDSLYMDFESTLYVEVWKSVVSTLALLSYKDMINKSMFGISTNQEAIKAFGTDKISSIDSLVKRVSHKAVADTAVFSMNFSYTAIYLYIFSPLANVILGYARKSFYNVIGEPNNKNKGTNKATNKEIKANKKLDYESETKLKLRHLSVIVCVLGSLAAFAGQVQFLSDLTLRFVAGLWLSPVLVVTMFAGISLSMWSVGRLLDIGGLVLGLKSDNAVEQKLDREVITSSILTALALGIGVFSVTADILFPAYSFAKLPGITNMVSATLGKLFDYSIFSPIVLAFVPAAAMVFFRKQIANLGVAALLKVDEPEHKQIANLDLPASLKVDEPEQKQTLDTAVQTSNGALTVNTNVGGHDFFPSPDSKRGAYSDSSQERVVYMTTPYKEIKALAVAKENSEASSGVTPVGMVDKAAGWCAGAGATPAPVLSPLWIPTPVSSARGAGRVLGSKKDSEGTDDSVTNDASVSPPLLRRRSLSDDGITCLTHLESIGGGPIRNRSKTVP